MEDKELEELTEVFRELILEALVESGIPRRLFECYEEKKKQLKENK